MNHTEYLQAEIERLRWIIQQRDEVIRALRADLFGWCATTLNRSEWDADTERILAGPAPVISETGNP